MLQHPLKPLISSTYYYYLTFHKVLKILVNSIKSSISAINTGIYPISIQYMSFYTLKVELHLKKMEMF
jgi:hypothetical protein